MEQQIDLVLKVEEIGVGLIATTVGVSRGAVRLQARRGMFPASWWLSISQSNIDLPVSVFGFKNKEALRTKCESEAYDQPEEVDASQSCGEQDTNGEAA